MCKFAFINLKDHFKSLYNVLFFSTCASLWLVWPQIHSLPSCYFVCNAEQTLAGCNCQASVQGWLLKGPGRKMENKKKGENRVFFPLSLP